MFSIILVNKSIYSKLVILFLCQRLQSTKFFAFPVEEHLPLFVSSTTEVTLAQIQTLILRKENSNLLQRNTPSKSAILVPCLSHIQHGLIHGLGINRNIFEESNLHILEQNFQNIKYSGEPLLSSTLKVHLNKCLERKGFTELFIKLTWLVLLSQQMI